LNGFLSICGKSKSSTLAGNLFLVGSIANLIVVSQAACFGIKIAWKTYMKVGFPVTVLSFLAALGWIYT
jgi:Na+/H+ antiporter NhaD/arsenite permease-like protein